MIWFIILFIKYDKFDWIENIAHQREFWKTLKAGYLFVQMGIAYQLKSALIRWISWKKKRRNDHLKFFKFEKFSLF